MYTDLSTHIIQNHTNFFVVLCLPLMMTVDVLVDLTFAEPPKDDIDENEVKLSPPLKLLKDEKPPRLPKPPKPPISLKGSLRPDLSPRLFVPRPPLKPSITLYYISMLT